MNRSRHIGCLFGSFNPPHVGHLIIAEYMATRMDFDEVQLIVSPQNPLKHTSGLAPAPARLAMTRLAVRRNARLRVNPVEFKLPVPSYTIDTLDYLTGKSQDRFSLIMGSDNLEVFKQWREWERLLSEYQCTVYLRPGYAASALSDHPGVRVCQAPLLDISATYIRERIAQGQSIRYLVPAAIERYITRHQLYR